MPVSTGDVFGACAHAVESGSDASATATASAARLLISALLPIGILAPGRGSAIVGRSRKNRLAIRQLPRARVARVGAVLGAIALDHDRFAHFQRVARPALAR